MYRTDAPDNTGSIPTKGGLGSTGFHTDGPPATVWDHWFANAVQEELCNTIEAAGITLDTTGDVHTQLSAAIGGGAAVKSHATNTGAATTNHLRAVIACAGSQATGAQSVCMASSTSVASGINSVALSSFTTTVSGNRSAALASVLINVSGNRSSVIASGVSTNAPTITGDNFVLIGCEIPDGAHVTLAGTECAAIACSATALGPLTFTAGAVRCVALACSEGALFDAQSNDCVVMATKVGEFSGSGAEHSAIIACGYEVGDSEANHIDIESRYSAAIGCTGRARITVANCIVVGSRFGTAGTVVNEQGLVLYNDAGQQILLDSTNGRVTCLRLRCDDYHALGVGDAATLGDTSSTSGTGPGTATQSKWLKININGTDHWLPAWV